MTDWPAGPDRHVRVALNGVPVADRTSWQPDPLGSVPVRRLVVEGDNQLTLTLPVDAGVGFK
jgi:hypothetical protein